MRTGSIYIIRNTVNSKVYVGQTTMTVHERFMTHMKPSTSKQKRGYKLYMALNKYGRDNFYVETLETDIPLEDLDNKEIEYIAKFDSYYHGYNSTKGGDGRIINLIDHEDELLEKAKNNVSAIDLAEIYDVNVATIYRTLHKLGFYYYEVDEEAVVMDALSGVKQADIAQKYHKNKQTVQRILRRNGVRFHKERVDMRTDFDVDGIWADYDLQMSISDICEKYNISKTTFYRIKSQYAFPTRKQIYSNIMLKYDIDAIRTDYLNGMKIDDICNKHQISTGSLYRIIKEENFGKR